MQYANIDGIRRAAEPGLKAVCGHCGNEVRAKCGNIVVHHWAHVAAENCDPWYEPETQWHRDWKSHFGEERSEISIVKQGARHIADVLTKEELVIEFQNSPISGETIVEREQFYEKIIWVINGEHFKDSFQIFDREYYQNWEPRMYVEHNFYRQGLKKEIKALVIYGSQIKHEEVQYILLQQKFTYLYTSDIYYYNLEGLSNSFAVEATLRGNLLKLYKEKVPEQKRKPIIYEWIRPRKSWQGAKAPVFIDLNDGYLIWVKTHIGNKSGEGLKISKKDFLEKYAGLF